MNESILRSVRTNRLDAVKKIMWGGFFLRLVLLVFMLTFATDWTEPYFISDDINYERIAEIYMNNAGRIIDATTFNRVASGFLQPFWPWVMCISSYIFKNIYAGRVINIVLSALCIGKAYDLTYNISENEKTAKLAAKLFAFLPVTVLTCCFPIKDIFLTYAVLFAFNTFVEFQNGKKIKISHILISALLLTGIYFTRGAVTELMLLFFAIFFIQRFIKKRNYFAFILGIIVCAAAVFVFKDKVMEAFDTKLDDYSEYSLIEGGTSVIRMSSITQLYKMPFAYFFATLQPMKLNLKFDEDINWWLNIISYLNISIYPIAIGNFIYIFCKKKNFFFWISSLVMYCAIIYLVLGVFRHYLFLIPVEMINYSLYREQYEKSGFIIAATAAGLLALIALMNIFLVL